MERWRLVWRQGFAPKISTVGLQALLKALEEDDQTLIQGNTVYPQEGQPEACCLIAYAGWKGDGLKSTVDIVDYFDRLCAGADEAFKNPLEGYYFFKWFDDQKREEFRRELIPEIKLALEKR